MRGVFRTTVDPCSGYRAATARVSGAHGQASRPAILGRRLRRLALGLTFTLGTLGHSADGSPDASVRTTPIEAGRLVEVTVPGTLLHVADACTTERCHGLLLLVETAGRRTVFLFDGRTASAEALDADLPPRADALAVLDVDGDGTSDVLAGEPGRLFHVGTLGERFELGEARLLAETRYLDLAALAGGGFLQPGQVAVPTLRELVLLRTGGEGPAAVAARLALPYRARREPTGLRLHTYPVTHLVVDRRTVFAVGPEAHGDRRLRTVLIEPGADAGIETEAWSWLPGPESVVGSWYASLNGRPALVVTTVRADRLGLFEKKKLRVFALVAGDRSRAGSSPSLAVETASHHWQEADPNFADADGDGLLDLVLVQPQGMGGKKLVVEAYLGRANAQFHPVALRSVVPANRADEWRYGGDVDGDGVRDLVTRSGGLVQVFRGLVDPKKRQVLERDPRWQILVESGAPQGEEDGDGKPWEGGDERTLEVRDFDRDGHAEILVRSERDGASVLRVVDPGRAP